MNVFIPIDHDWSFKFFEFNKPLIGEIDNFFQFSEDFYASAMRYVTTQINYNYGMTSAHYHEHISRAMLICEMYPKLSSKITGAFNKLYTDYRIAYSAMSGVVEKATPIVEPSGVLQGIVFTINTSWPPRL